MHSFKLLLLLVALASLAGSATAQLPLTGAGSVAGGGTPPVNCGVGAIDFSTGCVQPMFGGL